MALLEIFKRAMFRISEAFDEYVIEERFSKFDYKDIYEMNDKIMNDKIQKLSDEQLLSPLLNVLKKEDMYTEEISRMISKLSKEQLNMFHTCHPFLYPNETNVSQMARDEIKQRETRKKERKEKERKKLYERQPLGTNEIGYN